MCRLTGYTDTRTAQSYNKSATLNAMRDCLIHGGPDDAGSLHDPPLVLGHRRLSVLDLSGQGRQPMRRAPWSLAWNGELYNFRELRRELEGLGYTFSTQTDTEVALQAFAAWGPEAVQRFRGMFAFALWNHDTRRLLLGRDRLGIKPLYWFRKEGLLMFASELKAFHQHPGFDKSLDQRAVSLFLQQGYIQAPYCIYRHAHKLEPGCLLEWAPEEGKLNIRRYWNPADALYRQEIFRGEEEEALKELQQRMAESIRLRLVADVPLGAFLSGGVDSSLLTALLQKEISRPLKTFTIGFEHPDFNEAPHARAVAQHLGTEHHELICTEADFKDILPLYPELYDEPFGDSSGIPTLLLSRLARKQVTVSLSADGADELFGGYTKYEMAQRFFPRFRRYAGRLGRGAAHLAHFLNPLLLERYAAMLPQLGNYSNLANKFHKARQALQGRDLQEYFHLASVYVGEETVRRLCGHYQSRLRSLPESPRDRRLALLGLIDLQTYLEGDILTKVDRASMYTALEAREPFLDHRVVEFALSLPDELKLRGRTSKYLLRQLLYRYVPRELIERPKQGFAVPIEQWLHSLLRDELLAIGRDEAFLQALRLDGFTLRSLIGDFLSGRRYVNGYLIWFIYVLYRWHERWK